MPAVARIGDAISCGDTIAQGSGDVFANGIPVTRVGPDKTAGHCFLPTKIAAGSSTVFVNNSPVARTGDPIVAHTCPPPPTTHGGSIGVGSSDVFAG